MNLIGNEDIIDGTVWGACRIPRGTNLFSKEGKAMKRFLIMCMMIIFSFGMFSISAFAEEQVKK